MNLTVLIIGIVVVLVIFLILKLILKTVKWFFLVGMAIIILGVWFYGYGEFFDKVSEAKEDLPDIPELKIQKVARSIRGCAADEDCVYIVNPGDCRMVGDYCNNIKNPENLKKILEEEVLEDPCNKTLIETNETINCECKLHKEQDNKIKQWIGSKIEENVGYTYCWKKD